MSSGRHHGPAPSSHGAAGVEHTAGGAGALVTPFEGCMDTGNPSSLQQLWGSLLSILREWVTRSPADVGNAEGAIPGTPMPSHQEEPTSKDEVEEVLGIQGSSQQDAGAPEAAQTPAQGTQHKLQVIVFIHPPTFHTRTLPSKLFSLENSSPSMHRCSRSQTGSLLGGCSEWSSGRSQDVALQSSRSPQGPAHTSAPRRPEEG